jgi:hypothetical protein
MSSFNFNPLKPKLFFIIFKNSARTAKKTQPITITRAGVGKSAVCLTTDWTTGVRSPTEAEDFSSSLCVQTGSEARPASYPMGTGGPFPGGG